jgi:RNA polymerase sigma factor (sigma-70 family)
MKTLSDSQLIVQYQNGDENALSALVSKHQKELYTYIYYKVLDKDLANDFFQDVFIKVICVIKENRYNEEGKFILWVKRIAQNLIIDYFRAKSKRQMISDSTYSEEGYSIFDFLQEHSDNIESVLIKNQIFEDLSKMILLLPENQQEIIRLRFYDNLSFKEIAEQTDCSINTTLGRVRYAVINLRKIMQENKIILSLQ